MKINPFYVLPLINLRQIGHGMLNNEQINAYKCRAVQQEAFLSGKIK